MCLWYIYSSIQRLRILNFECWWLVSRSIAFVTSGWRIWISEHMRAGKVYMLTVLQYISLKPCIKRYTVIMYPACRILTGVQSQLWHWWLVHVLFSIPLIRVCMWCCVYTRKCITWSLYIYIYAHRVLLKQLTWTAERSITRVQYIWQHHKQTMRWI